MTDSELRIGNWVIFPYKGKVNFGNGAYYGKIKGIHAGAATNFDDDIFQDAAFPVYMLEPIPVTNEILEKCGFILDRSIGVWFDTKIHNGFRFTLWDKYANYNYKYTREIPSNNMDILYLHKLQNLYFELTGKELEINL
jgi:hypothetical protein